MRLRQGRPAAPGTRSRRRGAAEAPGGLAGHRRAPRCAAFAFLFLVLFAGSLRAYLRRTPAAEGLAAVSLAGAGVMAVGALTVTGIEYGLAHHLRDLSPASAQTLSFLSNELFLVVIVGGFLFALPSGLAILRGCARHLRGSERLTFASRRNRLCCADSHWRSSPRYSWDLSASSSALSRRRSLRFARPIALAISGAASLGKPEGSPRLRNVIRVAPDGASSQV